MLSNRTLAGLVALLAFLPLGAQAQDPAAPEILILGTVHLASPGRDLHNAEVDLLSAQRQRELSEFIKVLRRLRLAAAMGQEAIHAVDVDRDFPYYRVQNYAKAQGREDEFDSLQARTGTRVAAESEFLRTHSILETLALINANASVARAVSEYYESYMPFGQPYVVRRSRSHCSVVRAERPDLPQHPVLATSPDDRILVIYGAGTSDGSGAWSQTTGPSVSGASPSSSTTVRSSLSHLGR